MPFLKRLQTGPMILIRELGIRVLSKGTLLVEREGVVVTPGVGFGDCGEGHFRIALMRSPPERVVEGARRIANVLATL